MVALRGSTRVPPYQLSAWDEDLQGNPPDTGFAARGKEGSAIARALSRLNAATNFNLTINDFEATRTAAGDLGPNVTVEWTCRRETGHGERRKYWTMIIDMDDIPPGAGGAGPDRPHVGYSFWSTGYDPTASRINGHIFIEYVPASR